jgi:deoxyribose-phosphate aldolase
MPLSEIAARALPLLDLTDLTDDCTEAAIDALCASAVTPHGKVAAVCIYPRFVAQAQRLLAGSGVKVATVVNFPGGSDDTVAAEREAAEAVANGADEVDLVMPYNAFMAGRHGFAETQIVRVKRATGSATLKVILETGRLALPDVIRAASDLALEAGADFIKTSTGKVEVNATPEAARIMLAAIRASGRPAGFKAAGGVRTTADAGLYLDLADDIMGSGWASPATFRFGASGLLTDLVAQIDGATISAGTSAY